MLLASPFLRPENPHKMCDKSVTVTPRQWVFGLWSGDLHGNVTTRKSPRRIHESGRHPMSEVVMRVFPARSYNAGRAGLVDGGLCTRHTVMVWCFVTRLPDPLDDSDPSTRGLYSRPFQLCVLKIRVRYVFALCVTRASSYQCITSFPSFTSFTVIQSLYPVCIETPILRFLRVQIIVSCSTLSCSSVVFEQSLSLVVTLSASFLVV